MRKKLNTKQMAFDSLLAAMCAVLGYVALDTGTLKVTFESLPVILGAALFGPLDGALIGFIGPLVYQLLRYGVSVTTPLWILPYAVCGLTVGLYARRRGYRMTPGQTLFIVSMAELAITALNTGALYVDSVVYGYYSPAVIIAPLPWRLVICAAKAAVFGLLLPYLIKPLRRSL